LALTQGNPINLSGRGPQIEPLPDPQQPDQENPLVGGTVGEAVGSPDPTATEEPSQTDEPRPFPGKPMPGGFDGNPELQLFDFGAGRWYEFPHFDGNNGYVIKDPQRFVDSNGRVLLRLVNRSENGEGDYFQIIARMEGTTEQ
jgi:hypothetical protein